MSHYNIGYRDLLWCDASREREIPVAVWYPTDQTMNEVTYLAHYKSVACQDACIVEGIFPLVIISHGSRGHRYNQYYLAEHLSRLGYIVFAIEHAKDTAFDDELSGKVLNHEQRLLDVEFVLSKIAEEKLFDKRIIWNSIAYIGHSFGGFTGFIAAGGRCEFISSKVVRIINEKVSDKINCVVMMAPAYFNDINREAKLAKPTLLMTAGQDELLASTNLSYSNVLVKMKHINFEDAGHYTFLMECPEPVILQCPEIAYDPGRHRSIIHPYIKYEVTLFLDKNLRQERSL